MFILKEEHILKQTTQENFDIGKKLYDENKFECSDIDLFTEPTDFSVRTYKANIKDGNNSYEASIRIHDHYGILFYECNCPSFENFHKGMCPHVVALALAVIMYNIDDFLGMNEYEFYEQIRQLTQSKSHKKTEVSKDKMLIDSIIAKYQEQDGNYLTNVRIEPYITTQDMCLSLKIGIDYMYTVTDINYLLTLIKNKKDYRYGQKLSFIHTIESFDDQAQKLLDVLFKTVIISSKPAQYLQITPYVLEEIINIYRENSIYINQRHVYLSNDDYDINIKLTNYDTLELSISSYELLQGYTHDFIVIDKRLYNLSPINKDLFPIVEYLRDHKKLYLVNTMNDFIENLYPIIYGKIDIDQEFLDEHPIVQLIIDSYIDYDNGIINIEPKYENIEQENKNVIYDKKLEHSYYNEIKSLGFYKVNDKYIIDTAEGITKFLGCNLDGLKKYGAVFVSENLKNININQVKPKVSISYDVNMMSVCFEDLNYTNEELYEIYKAYSKQKKFVIFNKNQIVSIDNEFHNVYRLIKDLNLDPHHLKDKQKTPLYLAMKTETNDYVSYSKEIKQMFYDIKDYQKSEVEIPSNLNDVLRPYQKDGFKWLKALGKYGFGGILADDMGLGKTLQIITLIESDENKMPSLIICPTSLTYNWKNEIDKWTNDIESVIISGSAPYRYNLISNIKKEKVIYITSYDSLRRDIDFYKENFRFIIIDEAQYIKNYFTQKAQAVKCLNGDIKYALTGTPIENSLLDLWSIFDFLMPNYLGTYNDFRNRYSSSIMDDTLGILSKKIQPFVLRRTKKEVLKELPDKFEIIRVAQMGNEQRKIYESFLLKARDSLVDSNNKISILAMLTRLRQLCVDPKLYLDNYLGGSCKVDLCLDIITEAIRDNHRILLFSQFKSLFPIIAERLKEKNILFLELTGDTPSKERLELVDSFNNNESIKVFLISLKAGGTGLNLTGADTIIHFDPWWNVSTENQATDRAHRIGQKRIVQVNKIICENSIEQKVLELQKIKKDLSDRVIADKEAISKLTESDLKFLLS